MADYRAPVNQPGKKHALPAGVAVVEAVTVYRSVRTGVWHAAGSGTGGMAYNFELRGVETEAEARTAAARLLIARADLDVVTAAA
jgi:hypothetical protein